MAPLLLLLLLALVGQNAPPDKLCSKCKTTGRLDNAPKDEDLAALEGRVDRCSWRIKNDPAGRGLPFIACPNCLAPSKAAAARSEFDRLAKDADAWYAETVKVEQAVKPRDGMIQIATKHFDLVYGIPRIMLRDKRVFDLHAGAHLYAQRLEDFYTAFQQLLGYTDAESRVLRHRVFLMNDVRTLQAVGQPYSLMTDRAARLVGEPSIVVTWRDKTVFGKEDEAFHRHVIHHVSHNLQGIYYKRIWLVDKAGWLDEGIASVCEMKHFRLAGNSCNLETNEDDYSDSDWEPIVKKRVLLGKPVPLAELLGKGTAVMSPDDRLFAWSYVDFLLMRKPEGLRELLKAVKDEKEIREALREQYGLSVGGVQEPWAEWVKATYRDKPAGE